MKCSKINKELWRVQMIKTCWKRCCDSPELLVGLCSLLLAYVNAVAAVLRCHRRPRTTVSLEICLPSFFFFSPSSAAAATMPFHLASNQLPAFRFTKSQSRIVLTVQLDADRFDKPGRFGERSSWPAVVVVVVFKLSVQEWRLRERAAAVSFKRNKKGRLSH